MNLPAIPTDNLYKFMAISGIVILLVSAFYPLRLTHELDLKIVETRTQVELTRQEYSEVKDQLSRLEREKEPSGSAVVAIRQRNDKLQVTNIITNGAVQRLETLHKQLRFVINLSKIGVALGSLFSIIGFTLWYVRVQKPADLVARRQSVGS